MWSITRRYCVKYKVNFFFIEVFVDLFDVYTSFIRHIGSREGVSDNDYSNDGKCLLLTECQFVNHGFDVNLSPGC